MVGTTGRCIHLKFTMHGFCSLRIILGTENKRSKLLDNFLSFLMVLRLLAVRGFNPLTFPCHVSFLSPATCRRFSAKKLPTNKKKKKKIIFFTYLNPHTKYTHTKIFKTSTHLNPHTKHHHLLHSFIRYIQEFFFFFFHPNVHKANGSIFGFFTS